MQPVFACVVAYGVPHVGRWLLCTYGVVLRVRMSVYVYVRVCCQYVRMSITLSGRCLASQVRPKQDPSPSQREGMQKPSFGYGG